MAFVAVVVTVGVVCKSAMTGGEKERPCCCGDQQPASI